MEALPAFTCRFVRRTMLFNGSTVGCSFAGSVVLALRDIMVGLRLSLVRSMCAAEAKDADITQEWSDAFKEKWDASTAGNNGRLQTHPTKVSNGSIYRLSQVSMI